jgi:UDP-arabinose 4-epimerase
LHNATDAELDLLYRRCLLTMFRLTALVGASPRRCACERSNAVNSNVLVTGGAGYVGSHTCKSLAKAGYTPFVYDNLSTGHESFVRWGPLIKADIRDHATLREVLLSCDISAVLHFAACAHVGESVINPQKYYDNNVVGTLSLLRAMLDADVPTMVFSSSCAIYGEPEQVPIHEGAPKQPVNPYGASKLMIERVLSDYTRAYGLQFVALRYFNAAGADPESEVGELRDPETHLIPRAMMSIQGYLNDFVVFGSDYSTPDGTAIRDYIHVADLAEAHVAALRGLQSGRPNGAYNLGTGRGYSVKEVLEAITAETGEALGAPTGLRREGDPAELIADASLGRTELGWNPHLSDLQTIIRTAWAWHRRAHPKRGAEGRPRELSAVERPI